MGGAGLSTPEVREVDLDWHSVAWAIGTVVALVTFTGLVRSASRAVTVLAVGTLLALALGPLVGRAQARLGGHRAAGVAVVAALLMVAVGLASALLVPRAVEQAGDLGGDLDRVTSQINDLPVIGDDLERAGTADDMRDWIENLPERLRGDATPLREAANALVGGLLVAFLTVLVTVALLLDAERLLASARRLVPASRRLQAERLGQLSYETVGRYVAGSVLVAVIAGTVILVVGLVLRVPLAPLLAVWVAVFDLVPQIGGAVGGIPFVLLGFTRSATTGVICAVFFILYLQFENHVLGPVIVGRSVKLSPVATMVAALVGVSAAGVLGALLAVPALAAAKVVYLELRSTRADAETDVTALGGDPAPSGRPDADSKLD